jgi:hypothetical protein
MINRAKVVLLVMLVHLFPAPFAAGRIRREINLPDILGYKTLKCDFHMHTVFSDGLVWPTVRVEEAWREGLDAIAITDHIEYQPHKEDIPTNHARSHEIALPQAKQKNVLLIRGAEITRDTPPGHFNAIFLRDIDPLETEEFTDAVKAANEQNSFVFWNHPGWKPEAKGWFDIHTELYEKEWLHGIEVANGDTYYPEAHLWCLQKKLTMLGTSDIHAPDLKVESSADSHRTMTLVFAKERSATAVKEALTAGRTVVWYKDHLIGREKYLRAIFDACIEITKPHHKQGSTVWFEIRNASDVTIELERAGPNGPKELSLPADSTIVQRAKSDGQARQITWSYAAKNLLIAPEKSLPVDLTIDLE